MARSGDAITNARTSVSGPTEISVSRASTGDLAALHIRRLIFDGALKPGVRVPQAAIADAMGISRIPVREALIGLEREGWVRIELHRGAFINAFDKGTVRDHYRLYGLVYGFAAQRAIEREEHVVLGEQLAVLVDTISRAKGAKSFGRPALAFHEAVLAAAGSRPARTVTQALSSMVPGDFFALVPGAVPIETRCLPIIARAISGGHRDQAAHEYLAMMQSVGEVVCGVFTQRGLFAEPARRA
jgi:DNA-binding GntR family transcriptional regulator